MTITIEACTQALANYECNGHGESLLVGVLVEMATMVASAGAKLDCLLACWLACLLVNTLLAARVRTGLRCKIHMVRVPCL